MRSSKKTSPGFTLVELLVYLGMSTIVVVVISNFMVDISQSAARTRAALNLQTTSRLIVSRITQTVRTATSAIPFPPSTGTSLVVPVTGGNQTYALTGSTLVETLPTGVSDTLNSAETVVKSFIVTNQTIGVSISMTLGPAAITTPAVPDYTVTSMIVPRLPLYQ